MRGTLKRLLQQQANLRLAVFAERGDTGNDNRRPLRFNHPPRPQSASLGVHLPCNPAAALGGNDTRSAWTGVVVRSIRCPVGTSGWRWLRELRGVLAASEASDKLGPVVEVDEVWTRGPAACFQILYDMIPPPADEPVP